MSTSVVRSEFASIYRAHFAEIRQFIFHFVQDPAVADELTQDAFLRAMSAWSHYRGDAPERIWLLRIARNVCLDYVRSPRSRAGAALSLGLEEAREQEPVIGSGREQPLSVEQEAVRSEMTDCVQQFVLSLPETLRTPLILHDMHGFTNEQIAQVLGCSLQAAKMRLHRARGKLREMMEQRCDLFHDERNVLSCLPAPQERAFVSLDELAGDTRPARGTK